MPLFYLSFATDFEFLGATVVQADDVQDAIMEATFRGLNPGGQAAILQIPPSAESEPDVQSMLNRLVGEEEMMVAGGKKQKDLPPDIQATFAHDADVVCEDCNPKPKGFRR